MKSCLLAGAAVLLLSTSAVAQTRPAAGGLPYTQGPVWTYANIDVKPGQFDAYMTYLSGNWRRAQEAAKRSGDLLDYKVLVVDSPRAGEPDVVLAYQWKNMAVFDRSLDEVQAQSLGAMNMTQQQATQGSIDREAMRSSMGEITMRELRFR